MAHSVGLFNAIGVGALLVGATTVLVVVTPSFRARVSGLQPRPGRAGGGPRYTGLRMVHRRGGAAIVALCAVLVTACASNTPAPVDAVAGDRAGRLGRRSRSRSSMSGTRARSPASNRAVADCSGGAAVTQVRAAILRSLITDTVIREEAAKLGLAATPKEVATEVATDAQQAGGMSALETELAGAGGSIAQLEDEISSNLNEQRVEDVFAQQRAAMIEQVPRHGSELHRHRQDLTPTTPGRPGRRPKAAISVC